MKNRARREVLMKLAVFRCGHQRQMRMKEDEDISIEYIYAAIDWTVDNT